uniref:Large ribosomal subunit protein uL4m n=1 Tax=Brassica campestris TaxID=3711 RepID=M4EQN6_BRACM
MAAASISRRIVRTFGSFSASGNGLTSLPCDLKCGIISLVSNRKHSTSILTPDDNFPYDLLAKKTLITPDRTIGQYQDLVIPVTNFQNEDKGFMVLAGDVFDVPIRKDIIHHVVRWQLAKRQQGTHSTKTISEVSGTGRKPWNQKGTGRARHGTLRGPQFRGGCVMHGPKPRSHAIKINKQVRRLGLKIALSARAAEGKLLVFDDMALPTHKTKNIVNYYNQMENTKKVLVVEGGPIDEKLKLATQNLHYVNILPSIGLNVYSILLHDTLVMSRDAVDKITELTRGRGTEINSSYSLEANLGVTRVLRDERPSSKIVTIAGYSVIKERHEPYESSVFEAADGAVKRFNAAKKEWGFGQLISLATFQNTNQGYMCRILVLLVLRSSSLNQLSNRRKSHSYQTHQTMFSLGRFFVFSSLEDKFYYSDDFLVGDRYWRLGFNPKGDGEGRPHALPIYLYAQGFRPNAVATNTWGAVNLRMTQKGGIDVNVEWNDVPEFEHLMSLTKLHFRCSFSIFTS